MGRIGKGEEFGVRAVAQTFPRHFGQQKGIALAPEDARGDADDLVGKFDADAEESAIPVDHGSNGARLGPRGAVLGEIIVGEGPWAAGADERPRTDAEVESGEKGF